MLMLECTLFSIMESQMSFFYTDIQILFYLNNLHHDFPLKKIPRIHPQHVK